MRAQAGDRVIQDLSGFDRSLVAIRSGGAPGHEWENHVQGTCNPGASIHFRRIHCPTVPGEYEEVLNRDGLHSFDAICKVSRGGAWQL